MATTKFSDRRGRVGQAAEAAVSRGLGADGWQIVAQNVRWREGEIDLIGIDGSTLVFVEVKALVAHDGVTPFSPFESIGARKQRRIRALARRWLVDDLPRLRDGRELTFSTIRFDAFAVTLGLDDRVLAIEHLRDAF
ncbi:MAG: YraN family protein [Thermoleophilia bacterium]|nr:YraN family protein [Thermoleophilia bacterium]